MMKNKRFLDYIPGGTEHFIWDDETGSGYVQADYDLTNILKANEVMRNDGTGGWSPTREMKRVASIPIGLLEKWKIEEGIDWQNKDHWGAIKRKLNSCDWQKLRTDDLKAF
jgi:hypothetical protein